MPAEALTDVVRRSLAVLTYSLRTWKGRLASASTHLATAATYLRIVSQLRESRFFFRSSSPAT